MNTSKRGGGKRKLRKFEELSLDEQEKVLFCMEIVCKLLIRQRMREAADWQVEKPSTRTQRQRILRRFSPN